MKRYLIESIKIYCFLEKSIVLEFIPSESELFRSIPESLSKPIRKIFCILFDEKRVKNQSDFIRGIISNKSNSFRLNTWLGYVRIHASD